jgi:hypothetical protein
MECPSDNCHDIKGAIQRSLQVSMDLMQGRMRIDIGDHCHCLN